MILGDGLFKSLLPFSFCEYMGMLGYLHLWRNLCFSVLSCDRNFVDADVTAK